MKRLIIESCQNLLNCMNPSSAKAFCRAYTKLEQTDGTDMERKERKKKGSKEEKYKKMFKFVLFCFFAYLVIICKNKNKRSDNDRSH